MPQELINTLVNLGIAFVVALVSSLVAFVVAKIRTKLSEKELAVFDEIAKTVETVYRGMSASDKREAFEDLCRAKKVNVARGVAYLEQHIIPNSKAVNVVNSSTEDALSGETD